jgi:hypothetical protein
VASRIDVPSGRSILKNAPRAMADPPDKVDSFRPKRDQQHIGHFC